MCFNQSNLFHIQKNIMYKISVLLPLLFLGALAFPKNRGEDGNKIKFIRSSKVCYANFSTPNKPAMTGVLVNTSIGTLKLKQSVLLYLINSIFLNIRTC